MPAAPSEATPILREGRLPRIWASVVVWGVVAAMILAFRDLGLFYAHETNGIAHQPNLLVWQLYFWIQIANKVPISYHYQSRGLRAITDIGGFSAGMLAVAFFALQIKIPRTLSGLLLSIFCIWLVTGFVYQLPSSEPAVSFRRRAFCAVYAFLFPSLPMLGASVFLAAA